MNIVSLFAKLKALGVLVKADVQGKYFNIADTSIPVQLRIPCVIADGSAASLRVTTSNTGSSIAQRASAGTLAVSDAMLSGHATTLGQLDGRFSAESRAAIDALDPATATLEELINALQTPAAPAALDMIDEEDEML